MKLKANPFIFTFIHLFVESAPAHPKPRNVSPFKVITFYLLPILKMYEAATFCLTPMLQPHTFLLLIRLFNHKICKFLDLKVLKLADFSKNFID